MKESYLKYTGKGLYGASQFFYNKKSGKNFTLSHPTSNESVYLKQYEIDKGYKLAVCSEIIILMSRLID